VLGEGLRVVTVELSKSEEGIDRTKGTVVASVTDSKMQGLSMSGSLGNITFSLS